MSQKDLGLFDVARTNASTRVGGASGDCPAHAKQLGQTKQKLTDTYTSTLSNGSKTCLSIEKMRKSRQTNSGRFYHLFDASIPMSPDFNADRARQTPRHERSYDDLEKLTIRVGSMQELAALRREEGPRLQFEGFIPVVVSPTGTSREEVRSFAPKLQYGGLSESELSVLSNHVATVTFPKDARGQELCRKLIVGLNALNRMTTEGGSDSLAPLARRDLPLTRREQREYALRFAEMEFPESFFSDPLGRNLWKDFIEGTLPPHEEALLNSLISRSGRTLVPSGSGLTTLQALGDSARLFS